MPVRTLVQCGEMRTMSSNVWLEYLDVVVFTVRAIIQTYTRDQGVTKRSRVRDGLNF